MNLVKLIVLFAVLAFAYRYWSTHDKASARGSASATTSRSGFVSLPPGDGVNNSAVTVFAAEGCPEEAAQRADRLAEQLASKGIPVTRSSHVNFDIPNNDQEVAQRVLSVMNGELPIVLVRGKGKPNPTLDEVVAEYAPGDAGAR